MTPGTSFMGRASGFGDCESVREFLQAKLDIQLDQPVVNTAFLDWKYWRNHPYWHGSRSYILLKNNELTAHGAAWPVMLAGEFGQTAALHLIDWAASTAAAGAGMAVLKLCCQTASACFSIGGSGMTRKVLPAFGFKPANSLRYYALPLRPFRQFLTDRRRNWKWPLRWVRNSVRRYAFPLRMPAGWEVRPAAADEVPTGLWPKAASGEAVSVRDAKLYRHFESCPIAKLSLYLMVRRGRPAAYFALAFTPGQVRLVDYFLPSSDPDLAGAIAAAAQYQALSASDCCEILTAVTEPEMEAALLAAGYCFAGQEPIKILRLAPVIRPITQFRLTLLDSDAAVRHIGAANYVT